MPSESPLKVQNLGHGVDYLDALQQQERLVQARFHHEIPNTLLLLEHSPVYTIGRTQDKSSLSAQSLLPHPVHEISRGGQATYHGPGQLVGYPIIDLRPLGRDLGKFLRALEVALITSCQHFGIQAQQREGLTGIWVGDRKLASIGIGVKKWVTYHGFAINLNRDPLNAFSKITPCGLQGVAMTSLMQEADDESASEGFAEIFPQHLQAELLRLKNLAI